MRPFIGTMIAVALAVLAASKLFHSVRIRRGSTLVLVSLVFAVLNAVLGKLLTVVFAVALLPLGVLTLGLVYLLLGVVVNTALLFVTDKLLEDFEVRSFGTLVGTAGLISLASTLLRVAT